MKVYDINHLQIYYKIGVCDMNFTNCEVLFSVRINKPVFEWECTQKKKGDWYVDTYTRTYLNTLQPCIDTYIHTCTHSHIHTHTHTYLERSFIRFVSSDNNVLGSVVYEECWPRVVLSVKGHQMQRVVLSDGVLEKNISWMSWGKKWKKKKRTIREWKEEVEEKEGKREGKGKGN